MLFFMGSRCATGAPRRMACTKGTTLLRPGDARRRATGFLMRGLLSQSLQYAPAWKLVGQTCPGRCPMAGKGVRGRNDAGSILRPRAAFGSFRRDEKNAPGAGPCPSSPTFLALPFDTPPPRPLLYFPHERGDSIEHMALPAAADRMCMEPAALPGAFWGAAQASAAEADSNSPFLRDCCTFLCHR